MEKLLKYTTIPVLLFIDRVFKYLVRNGILRHDWNWFAFTYVTNTGTLFGLFQNNNTVFIILSVFALFFLAYTYRGEIAYHAITAGVIGNLIDRILYGHVIDMFNFKIWPVFNIADACIVVGVITLLHEELYANSSYSSNPSK